VTRLGLRRLGRSDVHVSPIGLGCWRFGGGGEKRGVPWTAVPQPTVDAIVGAALAGGVTWFDTAEIYGRGASERALARALGAAGKVPGEIVVATKWWPTWRFAGNLRRSIGDRLACLHPHRIDLYQVHLATSLSSIDAQMAAMVDLVRAGSIRAVGVSNFSAGQMRAAHAALAARGVALASNQVRWSLVDRRLERDGVLETARELGVSLIAYSPLGQGALCGAGPGEDEATSRLLAELGVVASALGATVAQVALAWLLARGEDVVVIPGATRVGHISDAAGALELTLDAAARNLLDEASRPFLETPALDSRTEAD
jgi:aryl-alcohol dehydrogenase-like predicted oxidoreductase